MKIINIILAVLLLFCASVLFASSTGTQPQSSPQFQIQPNIQDPYSPPFSTLTPYVDSVVVNGDVVKAYFSYTNSHAGAPVYIYQDTAGSYAYTYNVVVGNGVTLNQAFTNLGDPSVTGPTALSKDGFRYVAGPTPLTSPAKVHTNLLGQLYIATFSKAANPSGISWTAGQKIAYVLPSAMPITLSSFNISMLSNSGVMLKWTTVSEVNNYGFQVQKSSDLKNWSDMGSLILGHGTTLQSWTYSFSDYSGTYTSYRLEQLDLDGTKYYTDAISIKDGTVNVATYFALDQNYPNPFNPSATIGYTLKKDGLTSLVVYSMAGQRVATLVDQFQPAGQYHVKVDGSRLASGTYFYVLMSNDFKASRKMVLLK